MYNKVEISHLVISKVLIKLQFNNGDFGGGKNYSADSDYFERHSEYGEKITVCYLFRVSYTVL